MINIIKSTKEEVFDDVQITDEDVQKGRSKQNGCGNSRTGV
ncbi:hypothetical protein [Exiguobacterium sp. SH4S7]|nr:hypothetical protein [Exiguobacterium sp. SH4S7]